MHSDSWGLTSKKWYILCRSIKGGNGLVCIEDSDDTSIRRLKDYIKRAQKDFIRKSTQRLITEIMLINHETR